MSTVDTAEGAEQTRYISSDKWKFRVPDRPASGLLICVATIHPRGDQRVVRCTQSLLDAGFRVHIFWTGGTPGSDRWSDWLSETRLPTAQGTTHRLKSLPLLALRASRLGPAAWYIHDYYMLPFALIWRTLTDRPVIYDVHEFYGPLYASKLPPAARRIASRLIDAFQGSAARKLGGVNLVAERMREAFQGCSADRVIVTPNLPAAVTVRAPSTSEFTRQLGVIHTGSLVPSYGSDTLIEIARLLAARSSPTKLFAVDRFPSIRARTEFLAKMAAAGSPPNLVLVDAVPAHEVNELLAPCGIGLSLIQDQGQNPLAVPSKLFEYVHGAQVIIGSDLPAQRDFIERHAAGRLVAPSDASAYVQAIEEVQANWTRWSLQAGARASEAHKELTWEATCSWRLQALVTAVVK